MFFWPTLLEGQCDKVFHGKEKTSSDQNITMNIYFGKTLQDGKLTSTSGRIVIYKEFIEISWGPARDHNDLLRALASKYKQPKDAVISNAIRLYWDRSGKGIIVCPVRKLDEDLFFAKEEFHYLLINRIIDIQIY